MSALHQPALNKRLTAGLLCAGTLSPRLSMVIKSTRQRDKAIVKSVVALCRELDIDTVAEMVETRGQAEWLAELRVTFAQGYLFGRPSSELGHGLQRTPEAVA